LVSETQSKVELAAAAAAAATALGPAKVRRKTPTAASYRLQTCHILVTALREGKPVSEMTYNVFHSCNKRWGNNKKRVFYPQNKKKTFVNVIKNVTIFFLVFM